jgi:hypothetical protein
MSRQLIFIIINQRDYIIRKELKWSRGLWLVEIRALAQEGGVKLLHIRNVT